MKLNTVLAILIILTTVACGGMEEPHSQTHTYESLSRQLYVMAGKNGGYCVYSRERTGKVALVTTAGALSADQLGQSLSYMSYWAQTASNALPAVAWVYFVVRSTQESATLFEKSMVDEGLGLAGRIKSTRAVIGGLLLLGVAHIVNGMFRIIKGFYEGEGVGPIAAQFFFGWMPVNFLVEGMQRQGRVEALASEFTRHSVSEYRMTRLINKMHSKQPAFPDGCVTATSE